MMCDQKLICISIKFNKKNNIIITKPIAGTLRKNKQTTLQIAKKFFQQNEKGRIETRPFIDKINVYLEIYSPWYKVHAP